MLEVIDKGSVTESHPVPLLFVHGTWHAAWCWDEHFLDHFADRGFRALALSLRGHGCSKTDKNLRACGLTDYIADVESVVISLPAPPVMIGHSVGGFIVQSIWSRTMLLPGYYLPPRLLVVGVRGRCGHSSVTHG